MNCISLWAISDKKLRGRLHARWDLTLAVCIYGSLLTVSLWAVLRPGTLDDDAPGACAGAAALVAAVFALRASKPMAPQYRASWRLLVVTLAVASVTQAIALIDDGAQTPLWVWLGKVLPLVGGAFALISLLGLRARNGTKTRLVTLTLDAVVTGLAGLGVTWLIFEPQIPTGANATYTPLLVTLIATVLLAVVLLRLTQVPRTWFAPMVMLGLAGVLALPATLLSMASATSGAPSTFWVVAFGLVALAPLGDTWKVADDSEEPLLVQQFLPYLAAIAGTLAVAVARLMGRDLPAPVPGLVAAMAVCLAMRQLIGAVDEKRQTRRLLYLATHDPLTQLHNRSVLLSRLDLLLQRPADKARTHALLLLDLDEFKSVNDGISHAVGDELLRSVASRIQATVRPTDLTVRLGGDEFALLLENRRPRHVKVVCRRLLDQLYQPHVLQNHELRLSCSVGVALAQTGDSAGALLRKADAAMYAAKRAGKHGWRFFDAGMQAIAESELSLLQDLEQAVARGDLRLAYQPIVTLPSGQFFGAEALLRWLRPGQGWVSIGNAMPALEGSTLMVSIDNWVLKEACRQVKLWREEGWNARVGINVSGGEVADLGYPRRFKQVLAEYGVQPAWLALEVTEGMALSASKAARQVLQALRAMGVRLSIDDFGTAYSSLRRLREFGFDSLKIDKSFVGDGSDRGRKLLAAMVAMGQSMDVTVIAEGIELPEQAVLLSSLGCHLGQGFQLCPPVSADELERRFVDVGIEVPRPPRPVEESGFSFA